MTDKKTSIDISRPKDDYIRVIPLGGLDEVGMNCCLIECNGSMVMIDCGLTFPEDVGFGIDIILPDWSYVLENLERLDAVLLTHGHEDHIGALPFFLSEVDVPVYGGKLTLAMLNRKLKEHRLDELVQLFDVEPGTRLELGPFVVEFVHINHSVPNAMSIALETPLGRLVFTGDWKVDHTPINEPTIDLQRFAELGRDGVLALLGDSTNSGRPGYSRSERQVQEGLANVLDTAPGRVIVAQFSSNLGRIQGMLEMATQFDRKVCLLGRSLTTNFGLARELGFIQIPDEKMLVDRRDLDKYEDDELLLISTGSQGEPRSSLNRMAFGDHHQVTIHEPDVVVLSARVIPGNEVSIHRMITNLTRRGATVITHKDADIHCSGHAFQEEMKLMVSLLRPTHIVPMHGDFRMRKQHADLAQTVGVPFAQILEDGDVLQLTRDKVEVIDRIHVGRVFVDGRYSADFADVQLRDRKKLAHSGIVVAFAVMDRQKGTMTSGPDLLQRGFLTEEELSLLDDAADYARAAVEDLSDDVRRNIGEVSEALRTSVRRFFRKEFDRKPVVIPIVHEM